jgi:hypothetical protein
MGSHGYLTSRAIGALTPIARHLRPYAGNGGAVHVESSGIAFRSCDFVQTEAGANDCVVLLSWENQEDSNHVPTQIRSYHCLGLDA